MEPFAAQPQDLLSRFANTLPVGHQSRAKAALILALVAHTVFFLLLPALPEFTIPRITGESRITVFLNQNNQQQLLEQRLEQEFSSLDKQPSELEQETPEIQQVLNEDASVSGIKDREEKPKEVKETTSAEPLSSDKTAAKIKPSELFSASLIREFAKQETLEKFDRYKRQFERFKRSFSSRRPLRNQNRRENYKSIYGDQYSRASNAGGDICFLQKPEVRADDWQTNSVLFYRCNTKPKSLKLFTEQ